MCWNSHVNLTDVHYFCLTLGIQLALKGKQALSAPAPPTLPVLTSCTHQPGNWKPQQKAVIKGSTEMVLVTGKSIIPKTPELTG